MTKGINFNFKENTIEVSKAFEKKASKFGTPEYRELQEARRDYPTFKVVIKSAGKKAGTFKGLTLDYMKKYITEHDKDDKAVLKDFYTLCGLNENGEKVELAASATYGEIKAWFLKKHPVFEDYSKKINNVLNAA